MFADALISCPIRRFSRGIGYSRYFEIFCTEFLSIFDLGLLRRRLVLVVALGKVHVHQPFVDLRDSKFARVGT